MNVPDIFETVLALGSRSRLLLKRLTCCLFDDLVGKLNRGISVVDSYKLLKEGIELDENEFFLSCALGWCIEWVKN